MSHPLVDQLRFARNEFKRGLGDVTGPEAQQRFGNINCISWMVGHLAWQEQRYWLERAQGQILVPLLNELLAYGKPACTPPAEEMWAVWEQVTQAADPWLEELTTDNLQAPLMSGFASVGTFMLRTIYHYWYHLGEGMAVRQLLGHSSLPDFVGDIDTQAPFRSEQGVPLDEPMDKNRLLHLIMESRNQWEELLKHVGDDDMLLPGASGIWSLKDVIAHLTWHEQEMVGVLRNRALRGSDLWQLPLDQRNQKIYEQLLDRPLDQVKTEATMVFQQLIDEIEGLGEEDLHDPSHFQEFPEDWLPWELVADNTYRHYQDHIAVLKGWLANRSTSST
jgi:hypothetical protein